MSNYKFCAFCKEGFVKGKHQKTSTFLKNRFCSPSCASKSKIIEGKIPWAAQLRPQNIEPKTCAMCDTKYQASKTQSMSTWGKSKFCGKNCATKMKHLRAKATKKEKDDYQ